MPVETKKRVLVVDDELGIPRFVWAELNLAGYEVVRDFESVVSNF